MCVRLISLASLLACLCCVPVQAQSRKAPHGVFKELDDEILGDALIIRGKQLFIDDHVIAELKGVRRGLLCRRDPLDGVSRIADYPVQ